MNSTAQAEAAFQQALLLHRQSRLEEARALYERCVELQPQNSAALVFLSIIALEANQPQRAVELSAKAIQLNPQEPGAHFSLGQAQQHLQRSEAAIASYEKVIALKADFAEAHFYRGNALCDLKRYAAAVASYDRAIALSPNDAQFHNNRGNALRDLKQYAAAVASYDRAITLMFDCAEAHFNRGIALCDLKHHEAALASYDQAIALKADYAEAHCNRGNVLYELGQLEASVASYDQAIAINAGYVMAHCNRGNVLNALRHTQAALASYAQAISIDARYAEAYCNRGNLLRDLGQLDAALADFDEAIAIERDYGAAYFNRGFTRLLAGDLENGWTDYEWRWRNENSRNIEERRSFSQPIWLGQETLGGRTILVHQEQGLGDALQFCRYVKLLADSGARVILEVHPPLISLLADLEGVSQVIARGASLPEFDCWCPLLSLPLAFKTNLDSIPATTRYLRADSAKVAYWHARLGEKTTPRIGLAWSGSPAHPNDRNRNVPVAELLRKLPPEFQYVSLQKQLREADRLALQASPSVLNPADDLKDFSDSAALCECLDVVISVDTSVAHLSGALGRTTWVLLPLSPDWRWLLNRDDSPWYPTARLYRQTTAGDWSGVLERVRVDLVRRYSAAVG